MQVQLSKDILSVSLNEKETRYYFGKYEAKFDYKRVRKNLVYIYKQASIKAHCFPTNRLEEIKFSRSRKTGCRIVYKKMLAATTDKRKPEDVYLYCCNTSKELFETIEKLYKNFNKKCLLYAYNKNFYLYCETYPRYSEFICTNYYVKGILDEYAILLSSDAVSEIGSVLKNS